MKRRIRKKKHLAEFSTFGRSYTISFKGCRCIDALNDWVIEVVESQNCQMGGSFSPDHCASLVIQLGSEKDNRVARHNHILARFKNNSEITNIQFSKEFDLTYDEVPPVT